MSTRPGNWAMAQLHAQQVLSAKQEWEVLAAREGMRPVAQWPAPDQARAAALHAQANHHRDFLRRMGYSDLADELERLPYGPAKVSKQRILSQARWQAGLPPAVHAPIVAQPPVVVPPPAVAPPGTELPLVPAVVLRWAPWVVGGLLALRLLRR